MKHLALLFVIGMIFLVGGVEADVIVDGITYNWTSSNITVVGGTGNINISQIYSVVNNTSLLNLTTTKEYTLFVPLLFTGSGTNFTISNSDVDYLKLNGTSYIYFRGDSIFINNTKISSWNGTSVITSYNRGYLRFNQFGGSKYVYINNATISNLGSSTTDLEGVVANTCFFDYTNNNFSDIYSVKYRLTAGTCSYNSNVLSNNFSNNATLVFRAGNNITAMKNISNNNFINNYLGINIDNDSGKFYIENNNLTNGYQGIQFNNNQVSNNIINNNWLYNFSGSGIELLNIGTNNTFSNNNLTLLGHNGISIRGGISNIITNNSIDKAYHHGIDLWGCLGSNVASNNEVSYNTITNMRESHFIYLCNSSNNIISNNFMDNSTSGTGLDHGINIDLNSKNNVFNSNIMNNTGQAFFLFNSESYNNTLYNNTFSNTKTQWFDFSSANTNSGNITGNNNGLNFLFNNSFGYYNKTLNNHKIQNYGSATIFNLYNLSNTLLSFSNGTQIPIYGTNQEVNITLAPNQYVYVYTNYYEDLWLKLNSNNGTTAYDSSGNGNNGFISGATWDNDGVLVSLVNGVDYSLNTATGLLTLGNSYLYDWVMIGWSYYNTQNNQDYNVANDIENSLGEFGSWFEIIAILGIVGIVLLLLGDFGVQKDKSTY